MNLQNYYLIVDFEKKLNKKVKQIPIVKRTKEVLVIIKSIIKKERIENNEPINSIFFI